ncbi:MAG: hypothetical protein EA380_07245 [Phycisphaeraceae bacterium]|nr:MAG: hypothetical protein EA380_07245 [Phycisphaeraceae bacterium]
MKTQRRHPGTPRRIRRAFTLVELLVAVGVVALLTIGVGQIFRSIAQLSSTGSAVAEIESTARIVESLMRDDFAALSRVSPEQSFLAIRNRRLGDINRNGVLDANEVGLYLSRNDAEFDRRNGYSPYQRTSDGRSLSRATTVRLDEIAFIGFSGEPGGYASYQQDNAGRTTIRTPFARIYYGHGLRPPIDQPNNPNDPTRRLFYADGDFGSGPDAGSGFTNNRFGPGQATGRNQFAGDFVLTRQPLLLFGGTAAGYASAIRRAPLAVDQSFAPYVRDHEAEFRIFNGFGGITDNYDGFSPDDLPNPRLIRHGRTDVAAQSLEDVIRWLQGRIDPLSLPLAVDQFVPDASPFSTGILVFAGNPNNAPFASPDRWLWERFHASPSINVVDLENAYLHNLKGIQSAIAGMIIRPLVDPQPPVLRTRDPLAWVNAGQRPAEANMDLHAILAQHCSSFEVAWTDGTRWRTTPNADPFEYRRPGESVDDIPPRRILAQGDLLWFDMDFTYRDLYVALGQNGIDLAEARRRYPQPNPDPEIHSFGFDQTPPFLSQTGFPQGIPYLPQTGPMHQRRLAASLGASPPAVVPSPNGRILPTYSLHYTHGAPDFNQEYLAIWGFQRPQGASERPLSAAGDYLDGNWPKPTMIRVRMTLHDAQKRLRNGKTFEYVFRIAPQL